MESVTADNTVDTPKKSRGRRFVDYISKRCQTDKGLSAALKRADNPATEYQSWDVLAGFGVDLENENQRLPFSTIAAAVARSGRPNNGTVPIGQAIARCYGSGKDSDQAKSKLRRLLACDTTAEACRVLRPLFSLIDARGGVRLNYGQLLDDLLWFHGERQVNIKAHWAQDFYGREGNSGE
jgi:CRISPR system Cascade subunit CasB